MNQPEATPPSRIGEIEVDRAACLDSDLSAEYLEHHRLMPLEVRDGCLRVVSWASDLDESAVSELEVRLGGEAQLLLADEDLVRSGIRRVYGSQARTAEQLIEDLGTEVLGPPSATADGLAIDDLMAQVNQAPVVRLVHLLISEALQLGASDIHIEESSAGLTGRYRVDGVLRTIPPVPSHLASAVVSRLKVMARLDIAERRQPQDGRLRLRLRDRMVDARVSTLPLLNGEGVVIRLLESADDLPELARLGMPESILSGFLNAVRRPSGMVLVTGPTGSGKTTTLYAALATIQTGREKIITVEDPVEYELAGVAQVPVNAKVGLTFAKALRSILRQDPDVVLVGEIRDRETAEIAIHAALTGHLVLSTLHTNDAPSAIVRLQDLGIPRFLIASTVTAVLGQRLVRKRCKCRGSEGSTASSVNCGRCGGQGYCGRTGVFELFEIAPEVREQLEAGGSVDTLRSVGEVHGFRPLRNHAEELLAGRETDEIELARIFGEQWPGLTRRAGRSSSGENLSMRGPCPNAPS